MDPEFHLSSESGLDAIRGRSKSHIGPEKVTLYLSQDKIEYFLNNLYDIPDKIKQNKDNSTYLGFLNDVQNRFRLSKKKLFSVQFSSNLF